MISNICIHTTLQHCIWTSSLKAFAPYSVEPALSSQTVLGIAHTIP